MRWYESFGFEEDPHQIQDPPKIPLARLEWNRDDMGDQRATLDSFLEDATSQYKTGFMVYGAIGSGKTWFARIIEKEFKAKMPEAIVLRTKVYKIQPDFDTVYRLFVTSVLETGEFLGKLEAKVGERLDKWMEYFENQDLGRALYSIHVADDRKEIARNWILGSSVSASELREASISTKIDTNSYRYEVMRALLEKCVDTFPSTLLIVDELENAPPALARGLGDVLRELLDTFVEKFALCCLFTGQSLSEWYDHGYSEVLLSRLTYKVPLLPLQVDAASAWLRKHHQIYRAAGNDPKDQLEPFDESGLRRLLQVMDPGYAYPRYILSNCGLLAREAFKLKAGKIDAEFVTTHQRRLEYLAAT